MTGAGLAHVHAFEEARDPHGKGQRAAQVAEQAEAEGGKQGGNYSVEKRDVLNLQPELGSSSFRRITVVIKNVLQLIDKCW